MDFLFKYDIMLIASLFSLMGSKLDLSIRAVSAEVVFIYFFPAD